ncbi:MAG: RNA polymerase subunit sigma-24 [Chloroflexi bacterium HGW-Chloroflexi-4]|jgi:RNA polymerase sigma-70 factor (ECF subfamily)|nr:MAG: RNA polymerase subunit sigma-24 [Chloroflexi bacterium HGW-Chloroflexi-4]
MDETVLIQSAMKGELDAFNRLILAYQDLAFNVAYRMLNDEDQAADAVQNAFISAWRNLSTYRGGSFKAWVMRMVTNGCYDELRRQKRRPTTPLEPLGNEDQEEMDSPQWMASDDPQPETTLEQAELEHALAHCLDNLPVDFRAVVVLIDVQGMDYEEVAQSTRAPLGTVKSRLARARLKMRDCLQGFQELLPAQYRLEGEVRE